MASPSVPQDEIWRSIPSKPGYEASSLGRIRSVDRVVVQGGRWATLISYISKGRVLRTSRHGPYLTVAPSLGGRRRTAYVHRLVLEAFVGPAPAGTVACHNNGRHADNRPENLRWDTISANAFDKHGHGTHLRGETQNGAKLKEEDIRAIRRMVAARCPYEFLSRAYGVTPGSISQIVNRKTWSHVK